MGVITQSCGHAWGLPLMKFTLTYEGELRAGGNSSRKSKDKWEIRKKMHGQIVELLKVHPQLKAAISQAIIPPPGVAYSAQELHHQDPRPILTKVTRQGDRHLYEPLAR